MQYLLVALVALTASGLTLYSGFGLGTLLMPAFALFMPLELAVAATALVHGASNVLKALLLGRAAERSVVWRFGVPAILAALVGAWVLGTLSKAEPLLRYSWFGHSASVTLIKVVMALLMMAFAVIELHPRFDRLAFDRKYLSLGGALSGFFGGLSGHQGALRSAFLAKVGISTESFVGTNAVIALLVDAARIAIYFGFAQNAWSADLAQTKERWLVMTGIVSALVGVLVAKRLVKKVTMRSVQRITGGLLLAIALLLGSGAI